MEDPFVSAILSWLSELEDMPSFRSGSGSCRYGANKRKEMTDGITGGIVRDIMRLGVRFFYEVSGTCGTYGELQLRLCKEFSLRQAGATRKKKLEERVAKANEDFPDWLEPREGSSQGASSDVSSTEDAHDGAAAGVRNKKKSVSFVCPGTAVRAQNVKLIPALNDVEGTVVEALPSASNTRLLVSFPPPFNMMSLPTSSVALSRSSDNAACSPSSPFVRGMQTASVPVAAK